MTPGWNLWDRIAIVIALNSLHKDFDTTTASLIETDDKMIDEIQSILQSKEAKNISKQVIGNKGDLAMVFRDGDSSTAPKKMIHSYKECYNCHKLEHLGRDCPLSDKRFNRSIQCQDGSQGEGQNREPGVNKSNKSYTQLRASQNRAYQTAELNADHIYDNSDSEAFVSGPVETAFMVKEQQLQEEIDNIWFLDSCVSRYSCNNRKLFGDMGTKNIDFVTVAEQVIHTKEIGTMFILLVDGNTIELHNVAFAPECDSNLITLGQFWEGEIIYQDNPTEMALVQCEEIIACAKLNRNLFTLELAKPERTMAIFTL